MSEERLFRLFDKGFLAALVAIFVVALLFLPGIVVIVIHFVSKWW